jgi:2,4-dienoyl-CoA reductase-like NADH-dependent reductase (Old Yellow Enzyme family)
MPDLFSPLTIRSITLRNRIAVSPMCQYSCQDGLADEWHLVHLGSRAVGGAGLVIVEASGVEPRGRISPGDMGIWSDAHSAALQPVAAFIKQHGSVSAIQLAHAGRKASTYAPWLNRGAQIPLTEGGWQTIAPSPIPFNEADVPPRAMTKADISEIVEAFQKAAALSLKAGFQVIEIHAAHGYLINEFLSPLTNHRQDAYGGSLENRARFLFEIVAAIRAVWPAELPLFVRISASDWADGGWTIDDSVQLARLLQPMQVDLIDCSSGGVVSHARIKSGPGYQVPFAEQVKRESGIMTGAVGMITDPDQANEIISSSKADIVLLAREMLRDPYWPLHAARKLGAPQAPPVQYARAY